jgi:hypothetical protein
MLGAAGEGPLMDRDEQRLRLRAGQAFLEELAAGRALVSGCFRAEFARYAPANSATSPPTMCADWVGSHG